MNAQARKAFEACLAWLQAGARVLEHFLNTNLIDWSLAC